MKNMKYKRFSQSSHNFFSCFFPLLIPFQSPNYVISNSNFPRWMFAADSFLKSNERMEDVGGNGTGIMYKLFVSIVSSCWQTFSRLHLEGEKKQEKKEILFLRRRGKKNYRARKFVFLFFPSGKEKFIRNLLLRFCWCSISRAAEILVSPFK